MMSGLIERERLELKTMEIGRLFPQIGHFPRMRGKQWVQEESDTRKSKYCKSLFVQRSEFL